MTFYEYLVSVNKRLHRNPAERMGQCYMNELGLVNPTLHDRVMDAEVGLRVDPYYNNENLERFLDFVATNWEG